MEFSSRLPKVRHFGKPRNDSKNKTSRMYVNNQELSYREDEHLTHPELREMQRYGTLNVNRREIVESICNDEAVIIKQDATSVTALVRYSSRYYVAVMDTDIKVIKTFLPDTIANFLDYVQQFIDKENASKMQLAA